MSLSLADLRATKPTGRPERSVEVCLMPEVLAKVQALTAELNGIEHDDPPSADDDEKDGPPRRPGGAKRNPREVEIRELLSGLTASAVAHTGEMRVRANLTDGEWRLWVDAHPARAEGEPGHARDQEHVGGFCNSDALIDTLGAFVHEWNGEPMAQGDWPAIFEPVIGPAKKGEMAAAVVLCYEQAPDFQRLLNSLSTNLKKLSASDSPETLESLGDVSTGGSPVSSTADTTSTESPAP